MIKARIEKVFKKAKPEDIVRGNIVYHIGDEDILHRMVIDYAIQPNDDYKAFMAKDGCRCGLKNTYVLRHK